MKLRTLSEIAGVGAFIVALYVALYGNQNALDKLPKEVQAEASKDVEKLDLSLPEPKLGEPTSPALNMMKAALLMTLSTQRNAALSASVRTALSNREFKVALAATKKMTSSTTRNDTLRIIASEAVKNKADAGYAVVAAEYSTSSATRNAILNQVVNAYAIPRSDGTPSSQTSQDSLFKNVFTFANSVTGINLTKDEAKNFAEDWVKKHDEDKFRFFREVFIFASSVTGVNLTKNEAEKFSLNFISSHSRSEFARFQNIFNFANSVTGMNLTKNEALEHAMAKVKESASSSH